MVSCSKIKKGTIEEVSIQWIQALKNHREHVMASDFYQGRSIKEAKIAANLVNAEHFIISAGLGLINIEDKIPAYNLTISKNNKDSIGNKILNFDQNTWWKRINENKKIKSINELVTKNPKKLVILSLNTNYYKFIEKDLLSIDRKLKNNLRIIGPISTEVHTELQYFTIPYDGRLDSKDSPIQGTKTDFPQRALHHFCKIINQNKKIKLITKQKELVENSLQKLKPRLIPKREKKNDYEIKLIILKNWHKAQGLSGKMLRIIRDEECVACEQGRFKELFNEIKNLKAS